jgi:regulator of telomere elongation helicase 1
MEKVLDALFRSENALLESPTGTGKTLCLLCACLAWQREEARKLYMNQPSHPGTPRRVPTIIYASRTHSQLSQVVRELRNTRYRPKHAVLGSREQMCVNPKVKREGVTGSDINHDCSRLGQNRQCQYRNRLEGFSTPGDESTSSSGLQPVRDMEELVLMGQKHRVCPFYYTRNLVEDAELILIPYNYLFDKDARTSTLADVPWKDAVVIFDEAHNLESFASESASFDLTTLDIAGCIAEIQRAVNYMQTVGAEEGSHVRPENVAKLKTIFLKLEDYIMNSLPAQTIAYKGEFMMELFQKGAHINHGNHELFLAEVRKLTDIFLQFGGKTSKGAPRLDHFCQCVKRVFGEASEARCFAKAQSYRVHITQKQTQLPSNGGSSAGKMMARTVSYWCFAPSEAMRELANLDVRSILVTSGTLSPLESYALELDLPFPHRLENPHIIPDDQIHVRVIGKGVSNKILSSAYERRQDDDYYTELGNTIISLGKIIPGGMLVFFPSYGVMETSFEKWGGPTTGNRKQDDSNSSFFAARKKKATGSARYSFPYAPHTFSATKEPMTPWKRLLGVKAVVVEPKSTAELPDAINEFHKYLNLPKSKGVALFGVCRGKISEGIDFAHDMCRAVVITGLPFAPSFDPKVKMKREFLDQNRTTQSLRASADGGFDAVGSTKSLCLSGHEWYTQQAHRAVNQAIGRVIRNKDDYGAVLLLDCRFGLPANQMGLSKWVRPYILPDEGMGKAIGSLSRFYREAAKKAEERDKFFPPPPNSVNVTLGYEKEYQEVEDEDDTTLVTNIAYVEATKASEDDGGLLSNSCYIRQDQVIERVKMNESSSEIPKEPLSVGLAKPPTQHLSDVTKTTRQETSAPSPAQRFFVIVQEKMTTEQQSRMKHAAVAMRPGKDGKFGPKFNQSALEMVRLILNYEKFDGQSRDNKPEMLMLLMQLLPATKLEYMQRLVVTILFNDSPLGKALRAKMKRDDFVRCRSQLAGLLLRSWFKEPFGSYVSNQQFLFDLEKVLSGLKAAGLILSEEDLIEFTSLVPSEVRSGTAALLDHLEASRKILMLKAKEKASTGENSLELARFRSVQPRITIDDSCEGTDEAPIASASESLELPVASISGADEELSKRSNPYTKRAASVERPLKSLKSTGVLSSRTQNKALDAFQTTVQSLEFEVFTGKLKTAVKHIDSNAPEEMECHLCEQQCAKVRYSVFLAVSNVVSLTWPSPVSIERSLSSPSATTSLVRLAGRSG